MNLRYACLILTACTVAWTATAYAQSTQPVVKFPTEIEFKAPLSPGSQTAVLYGDPTKPGVYVQRTKFAPDTKVMPHWHPDEWRTAVVLSGTLYLSASSGTRANSRPIRRARSIRNRHRRHTTSGRKMVRSSSKPRAWDRRARRLFLKNNRDRRRPSKTVLAFAGSSWIRGLRCARPNIAADSALLRLD
jgi:hypothetical protein